MIETGNGKVQFRIELILALIITGLACAAGFSNLLLTPNTAYPGSTDFMGHMAKIQFIANSLKEGILPSWFPYWYNGTAVTQYYPPLSYYIMACIHLLTNNVMLTFKISCFIMMFIGGIGIWYFCRTIIGRWCGLFGSIIFCLQPFLLQTLFGQGQIAQGPIIALTPWYLVAILSLGRKPTAAKFAMCTGLCTLMILSHPNSIFMFCICIMFALTVFLLMKKITFQNYVYVGLTIIFAGVLTAFWSIVGVTGLENPTIPYLLGEAVMISTATKEWFLDPNYYYHFAISVSLGSIAATLMYAYRFSIKKIGKIESYNILFGILLTYFSMIFSFGLNLPFFEHLPMAENFVAGRILTLTSVTAAILCAYILYEIQALAHNRKLQVKVFASVVCLTVISLIAMNINPYLLKYSTISDVGFKEMVSSADYTEKHFNKGRYSFIGAFSSTQSFLPLQYNYNLGEGFNIEGTPHNQAIWNQSIALASDNTDYTAKNLLFWNTRYINLIGDYDEVVVSLNKKHTFRDLNISDGRAFYISDAPSSYFLTDKRNALILGAGSPGLAIEFPYLVYEQRLDISDYTFKELQKYKVIYLCEPAVKTLQDKKNIEAIVEELIDRGVTVLIEPTNTKGYQLFDIAVSEVVLEGSPTILKQPGSKIDSTVDGIEVDESMQYGRAMFGLDEVYYRLIQNDGRLGNDIIGTKKVGKGEVVFIGKHLSQYLKAVYARNWGVPGNESGYPECADEVKSLFTDIFKTYGVNTNFWPEPFPVKKADWNYKGVDFEYSSQKAQEMTLSVTYAPRWKATLDGKPIVVGQKENLITLNLPSGEHEVTLVYGLTKYGIAGYIISLVGLLLFVLFIKYYGIIMYRFRQISIKFDNYLQLDQKE